MDDLRKALFRALRKSDANMLRAVLAQGVSLDFQDGDRCPVFLEAINSNRNDIEILEILLAAGADLHARFAHDGACALHWVVGRERPDALNWFLTHGLDVNARSVDGTTPLMNAIDAREAPGHAEGYGLSLRDIRILLAAGADAGFADQDGSTALHSAAARGLTEVADLLLSHGAPIDAPDVCGETPLLRAASAGRIEMVDVLLARGANPSAQGARKFGALHDLAANDAEGMTPAHLEIAERLIAAGAAPDMPDEDGLTPLCWAAATGNAEMAKSLLRHGATADVLGGYALREAIFFEYDAIVDCLLDAGAGVDIRWADGDGDWGNVPLTIAAHEDYGHGIAALLNRGADIAAQTTDGETALLIAVRCGNHEAADLLLKRGADRAHADRYGNTAASWALKRQDAAMTKLLSQHPIL